MELELHQLDLRYAGLKCRSAVRERRLMASLAEREGLDSHNRITGALLAYGERRMSAALQELPDGVFRFEDVMEWKGSMLPVVVTAMVTFVCLCPSE